ncbi:MAG: ATP cone domain-containing protein [Minisyncoccia bacterium]
MAKEVIKKSGQREPFDPDKIKDAIWGAAQRTDLSDEIKDQIVEEVSEKIIERFQNVDVVATSEIRDAILEELDNIAPDVATSWREYEAKK